MRDLTALAEALLPIVGRAGSAIMRIYGGAFEVEHKDDNSPLTQADLESQRIIIEGLQRLNPDIPVLAEESAAVPWKERAAWRELWVVDPLDGTREFVKRNGEFTINVALVVDHEPVLGVVAAPALGVTFWGAARLGAHRLGPGTGSERVHTVPPERPTRVVGSRSHSSPQILAYLQNLGPHVLCSMGSSLKFCLIAEGKADLYPRFGATSEWDTAAGQAVLEAAGGHVTRMDGHRLRYNCRESLINGDFVAFADAAALPPP
jgi:3'(2'), 5'-bisphosphate nucleotidase